MSGIIVPIISFDTPLQQVAWKSIDDVVMGGRSQSRMMISSSDTAIFEGQVSLENFGGFASIRSQPQVHDLSEFQGLQIRVRGDGRIYQMRLISSQQYTGIDHVAEFRTQADHWLDIRLPFRSFRPIFRGMPVPFAPRLNTSHIYTFGFLIARKQAGRFRLEIDSIQAYQEA